MRLVKGHGAGWGQQEWEGLLEMEGEAGGLGTQAGDAGGDRPEHWDPGRDEATRGLKKSHDPPPVVTGVALAEVCRAAQRGGVGQKHGPVRRPWQRESSLGLRRAWTRALGGRGLGQGWIWIRTHRQVGWKVYAGEGPVDLRPRPRHPFLGLSLSEPRLRHKAN